MLKKWWYWAIIGGSLIVVLVVVILTQTGIQASPTSPTPTPHPTSTTMTGQVNGSTPNDIRFSDLDNCTPQYCEEYRATVSTAGEYQITLKTGHFYAVYCDYGGTIVSQASPTTANPSGTTANMDFTCYPPS